MSTAGQDVQASSYIQEVSDVNAVRYFTIIGAVVLLYDHALTFKDEIRCIWKAPSSFAKYAFLVNRYLVAVFLIVIVHEMCGFNGMSYGDKGCRILLSATSIFSVLSVCLSNALALMRVVVLWKEHKVLRRSLYLTYFLGTIATLAMMLLSVITLVPDIKWSPEVHMCITTTTSPYLGATWGAPVFFELHVIVAVVYHTVATPRSAQMPLTKALQRDGLIFFIVVLVVRLLNLILAVVARPSLTELCGFFVWASVTTAVSRSLLHLRSAEIMEYKSQLPIPGGMRTESPFGIPIGDDDDDDDDDYGHELSVQGSLKPLHISLHLDLQPRAASRLSASGRKIEEWASEW